MKACPQITPSGVALAQFVKPLRFQLCNQTLNVDIAYTV